MRLKLPTFASLLLATGLLAQSQSGQGSAPSGEKLPAVDVKSISFENVTQISTAQQDDIASNIKSRTYHGSAWLDEVDDRIRYAWQKYGYFEAKAHSNSHQTNSDPQHQEVEIVADVDEGRRYVLAQIDWKGACMFTNEQLDATMPIHRLDNFDVGKVRQGLENLRKLYETRGYVHVTAVPETTLDDANGTVVLALTVEPGEEFRVGAVSFVGGTEELRKRVQKKWPLHEGDPFNPELMLKVFAGNTSVMPEYATVDQNIEQHLSEEKHTVALIVHLERR